ncbi:hypothetical protein ACQE3E_13105 [Methylomonas sp. MED-D]|uniref:hypothetical protein n=1 Tax=Methylomonas sp. MED-D TaxID=3418768 RepID=UPI003D00C654
MADAWIRLDCEQITPWMFMTAGPPFKVQDFYGKVISYQGLEFDGSPRQVFWGRYIEPFLEDITDRTIKEALQLCADKSQDARQVLPELEGLLKSLARKAYDRMELIDRRLRAKSVSKEVEPRNSTPERAATEDFISRRVAAELSMYKPRPRLNALFNNQPFWFWLIALLVGVVATLLAG